jgi:IS1 family transposase
VQQFVEKRPNQFLALHNGKQQENDFLVLWNLLKIFDIQKYHTDDCGAYSK